MIILDPRAHIETISPIYHTVRLQHWQSAAFCDASDASYAILMRTMNCARPGVKPESRKGGPDAHHGLASYRR